MSSSAVTGKSRPVFRGKKNWCINILIITVIFLIYVIMTSDMEKSFHPRLLWKSFLRNDDSVISRNFVLQELNFIHVELSRLEVKGDPGIKPVLQKLENLIKSVESTQIKSKTENTKHVSLSEEELDVCPEVYKGTKFGYMYFVTGWVIENCTNSKPFKNVITLVVNPFVDFDSPSCAVEKVINGIRKTYKEMPIIVPNYSVAFCSKEINDTVHQVTVDKKWTPGRKWNALVKNVNTPYVFIGRDLDNFVGWISRLERQVRVISSIPRVQVAGGAVRNRSGHWRVGCHQSDMRNYVLRYEDGYYTSKNECMYCDYLMGPFVVKTELLKEIPFDEKLPTTVLFEDFFIKVKERSYLVLNCPDAMHFASDNTVFQKENNKQSWQPLVKKWELNRIVLPNGKVFGYSCGESGLNCRDTSAKTKSFLLPPCCLDQYAKAVSVFHEFCKKHDLVYELDAGSALGLVKMSDYIPWDLDGDFTFYTKNYSLIKSSLNYFKQFGIKLTEFEYTTKDKTRSYFRYRTPDLYAEFWGEVNLSKDLYEQEIFKNTPTKAKLHNIWVYSSISPGLLARNRYGVEILRHAHSWIHLGMKSSWEVYHSGKFMACKKPNHHACLDHFSTDGNLQFKIPFPN